MVKKKSNQESNQKSKRRRAQYMPLVVDFLRSHNLAGATHLKRAMRFGGLRIGNAAFADLIAGRVATGGRLRYSVADVLAAAERGLPELRQARGELPAPDVNGNGNGHKREQLELPDGIEVTEGEPGAPLDKSMTWFNGKRINIGIRENGPRGGLLLVVVPRRE